MMMISAVCACCELHPSGHISGEFRRRCGAGGTRHRGMVGGMWPGRGRLAAVGCGGGGCSAASAEPEQVDLRARRFNGFIWTSRHSGASAAQQPPITNNCLPSNFVYQIIPPDTSGRAGGASWRVLLVPAGGNCCGARKSFPAPVRARRENNRMSGPLAAC